MGFVFFFFGFSSIKEDVEVRESLSGKQTRNEQAVVGHIGTLELHPEFCNVSLLPRRWSSLPLPLALSFAMHLALAKAMVADVEWQVLETCLHDQTCPLVLLASLWENMLCSLAVPGDWEMCGEELNAIWSLESSSVDFMSPADAQPEAEHHQLTQWSGMLRINASCCTSLANWVRALQKHQSQP